LGQSEEKIKDEDDTNGVVDEAVEEGRIWHVQAHARSAVTSMKIDPINGSGVSVEPISHQPVCNPPIELTTNL
jgi:hypothetical protein